MTAERRAAAESEMKRQEEAIARKALTDAQNEAARAEQVEAAEAAMKKRMARIQEERVLKRHARDEQMDGEMSMGMPADSISDMVFSQLTADGAKNEFSDWDM
mmetsp:Transcript_8110/g.18820  ORF Transcript_8110/g.18820 Transcript_8110/m.18820 type:complete len:103 (+) Transcript_8110:2-310(+)